MNLKILFMTEGGKGRIGDECLKGAAYHVKNTGGQLHTLQGTALTFLQQLAPGQVVNHLSVAEFTAATADAVLVISGSAKEMAIAQQVKAPQKLLKVSGSGGAAALLTSGIALDEGAQPGPHGNIPYLFIVQSALDTIAKTL